MTWIPDTNELAPGVTIERRAIFWAPLAVAAAVLRAAQPARAANTPSAAPPLDWDDFIHLCPADAAEFARDASETGQDAYLYRIAAWAVRLNAAPDTKLGAFPGLDPKVEFGPSFRGVPFAVIQWRMAPRAILPAHCHPQASVCTVGIEGEARVRHFDSQRMYGGNRRRGARPPLRSPRPGAGLRFRVEDAFPDARDAQPDRDAAPHQHPLVHAR